jgi:hypothetical protein
MYERKGTTELSPKSVYAVVEPGILTGERIPSRVVFEFTKEPIWKTQQEDVIPLTIGDKVLTREDTFPRIDVSIENTSVDQYDDVEVVAVVYDESGNAMGASRTIIDRLIKKEKKNVVFTWPFTFPNKVATIEIIPSI